ncbi:hypothetical protein MVES_002347 [Malassezia vespertilionis]|uniref:Uncharacterized protein n=1 Tax=Malassezia vespertilionis TaxID=2020962 RepID=A0A2N1JA98_9BASI|nr:hypothetical protein MVES_002347 [Malassezia vespertilionis]
MATDAPVGTEDPVAAAKEERKRLDDAILATQKKLAALPTFQHTPNNDALSRQLEESIAQHSDMLSALKKEFSMEKHKLENEKQLLDELRISREALVQTDEPLDETHHVEHELMRVLVNVTNKAFEEAALCAELRFLLEALLNAVWERPQDPYVQVDGYSARVVEYVKGARIAECSPKNRAHLHLVAFHEPLPDPSGVRPSVYR